MDKMSYQDALCIMQCGWNTEVEKQLYIIAVTIVQKKGKQLQLKYSMEMFQKELDKLDDEKN